MLKEMYMRIYPTVHDTNNLFLGSTTGWNRSNSSGTLHFNYNSTNEMSLSSGGNLTINGTLPSISKHTDVSISSPSNNKILQWNSSSSKWNNANLTHSLLTDTSISSINSGIFTLEWNTVC